MLNLADLLAISAGRNPDAVALIFRNEETSYRALDSWVNAISADLVDRGVKPGVRVALCCHNEVGFVAGLHAILRAGGVAVPIHSHLTTVEAAHILSDSTAAWAIVSTDRAQMIEDAGVPSEKLITTQTLETLRNVSKNAPHQTTGGDDLALLCYTSGTSGTPKGAMLTHAQLAANLDQMRNLEVATRPTDRVLAILPLFHIFGLNVVVNLSLAAGATIVLEERFDPVKSLDALKKYECTLLAAAPPVYVAWLALNVPKETFSSVRIAVSGAAPLDAQVCERFPKQYGVTIWEGYGMTETAPALTSTAVSHRPKPGSIGQAIPGVDLKLFDDENDEVDPGDAGEIRVKGPNVFSGYWNHPEDTQTSFCDGWFKTGDIAVEDDEGDLFLVDRQRDVIIVSGFNVYPKEVEDAFESVDGVAECAVVGEPDLAHGEAVVAFVVLKPGIEFEPDALTHAVDHRLAPYKRPARVQVVAELPHSATGKVLRRILKGRAPGQAPNAG